MVGWAVAGLIVSGLLTIIISLKRHRLYFNKLLILVALVSVAVLFFNARFGEPAGQQVSAGYHKNVPPYTVAPYIAVTPSRLYYVSASQELEDMLLLTNYYYYDKDYWQYSEVNLPLRYKDYGEVVLIKRKGGQ